MIKINLVGDAQKVTHAVRHSGLVLFIPSDKGEELLYLNDEGAVSSYRAWSGRTRTFESDDKVVSYICKMYKQVEEGLEELGLHILPDMPFSPNQFKKKLRVSVPRDAKDVVDTIARGKVVIQLEVRHVVYTAKRVGETEFEFTTSTRSGDKKQKVSYFDLIKWVYAVRRELNIKAYINPESKNKQTAQSQVATSNDIVLGMFVEGTNYPAGLTGVHSGFKLGGRLVHTGDTVSYRDNTGVQKEGVVLIFRDMFSVEGLEGKRLSECNIVSFVKSYKDRTHGESSPQGVVRFIGIRP